MIINRPMYFVVQDHRDGPYVPETAITRTSKAEVAEDLLHGQYSNVLAVIEVDIPNRTSREATHGFERYINPRE